jgi:bifunctional non-homologous end joining protein LigD
MASSGRPVRVGDRELKVSNLDKVLYPQTGTTKGNVIDYYARIAPVMLAHTSGRCVTLKRFPNGVDEKGFFEKRCPAHRPEWIPALAGPGDRNGTIGYCQFEEPAALVWAANMAALELHLPMARAADLDTPLMMVFDFDPGEPATIVECCAVALGVREVLDSVGLAAWPKTSGSKGLQVYVPLHTSCTHEAAADFALAVGQVLEKQQPSKVTTVMAKAVRPGKVFVDWSQNARHKTTIGVYSLRARPQPTVSTPLGWDEVEAGASGDAELRFDYAAALDRVDRLGDLFAPTLSVEQGLPRPR